MGSEKSPKRALILSGGGARGAYAAGIIRYIIEEVSEDLGHTARFDIISGTSVGAINAAWLASTIHDRDFCVQRLWYLWRTMELARTVRLSYRNIWTMFMRLFRETSEESIQPRPGRSYAMLDTNFFADLIGREIPFDNIQDNIRKGLLDAVTITATEVHTGRTTVFVQSEGGELPPWTRDPRRVAVAGPITSAEVLASAAIPVLFPAVRIGPRWYFDGGLRQNTPISPALRMGADRLLIISLKSPMQTGATLSPGRRAGTPTLSFLVGKVLNALLLDPLDYDLSFLERINGLLHHGQDAFGEDFVETLNEAVEVYRGQGYRIVDELLFRPSDDLGQLASEFAGQLPDDAWGNPALASLSRRASELEGYRESDFLSYLLFDGGYTGQLLDLGYNDAKEDHAALVRFFTD